MKPGIRFAVAVWGFGAVSWAYAISAEGPTVTQQRPEGWQAMRVIHQQGSPSRMQVADLGDGRDQLIVINTRQARLELYEWLPKEKRQAIELDAERPNELPMAPEWKRTEIGLDKLPHDVAVVDLDDDGKAELLVLTGDSNELLIYRHQEDGKWKQDGHYDLLPGSPAMHRNTMLVRKLPSGKRELLLSTDKGIQTLLLEPKSRAAWLTPRESNSRSDWMLCDLDGDGDLDLLEWSQVSRQTVRWFECSDSGNLLPAKVLHDLPVRGLGVLQRAGEGAEVLLLGGTQDGLLRRYHLTQGEESPIGRQDSLPMSGGTKTPWCGVRLGDQLALVAADPAQPRLRVHGIGTKGWLEEQSFPTISNVRALVAPQAKPGELLLWVKDAAEVYRSQWKDDRLTFPMAWRPDQPDDSEQPADGAADAAKPENTAKPESAESRKILTLESAGDLVWWAQKVGDDLDLYLWPANESAPRKTRFTGLGGKTEKVVWLGGERLLIQQAFSTAGQLVELIDGKPVVRKPAALEKVDLSQYTVYQVGDEFRPARQIDGVIQWLNDELEPVDQAMLPDGQRIASYLTLPDGTAWALEQGGGRIHQLEARKSGVQDVVASHKPPVSGLLRYDPLLGLVVGDQERIIRLTPGKPWELELLETIDSRVGRPSGVREATIHRFTVADITGNGTDEVLLFDDRRHQITVVEPTPTELRPLLSWQVFEDQAYPYGGESDSFDTEPRLVVGFNADGDLQRDVAMLCHDRLLIYLGREEQ